MPQRLQPKCQGEASEEAQLQCLQARSDLPYPEPDTTSPNTDINGCNIGVEDSACNVCDKSLGENTDTQ